MAPIFVGSNSDDTRIRSNRVGLAASTSDPGSASEGDIYYDSTNNQVKTYDGSSWSAIQGSGSLEAVASGSLSNGQTVILQSDGTVTGVAATSRTQSVGSKVNYSAEGGYSYINSAVYDPDNKKIIVFYYNTSDSNNSRYAVGTVSGTSISFNAGIAWNSSRMFYVSPIYDSDQQKIVIAYRNSSDSNRGYARAGSFDGTTITFGSEVAFTNSDEDAAWISGAYDSINQKILIAYENYQSATGYTGRAVVATVSGTSISFGTPKTYIPYRADETSVSYNPDEGKFVIASRTRTSELSPYPGYIVASTAEIKGSSFHLGGAFEAFDLGNGGYTMGLSCIYDSSAKKHVIFFSTSNDNPVRTKAVVTTIEGTSLSFADPVNIDSDEETESAAAAYDPNAKKIVVVYKDKTTFREHGTYVVGSIVGTAITFGTPSEFESAEYQELRATYDSDQERVVVTFRDSDNSNNGAARVFQNAFSGSNVTEGNFIGFSDAAYSDGDTAKVQLVSTIDDAQSGLTAGSKHYVQNDGSLGTTADDPSVIAGTAVSGTEILIKQ